MEFPTLNISWINRPWLPVLLKGATRSAGHALVYTPGASPPLVMVAVSSRGGTSTLEFADKAPNLTDGKAHTLLWTRSKSGVMSVTVDHQELMRVPDRSFRQPFRGFQIINRGGDYAIRQITIDGATRRSASGRPPPDIGDLRSRPGTDPRYRRRIG